MSIVLANWYNRLRIEFVYQKRRSGMERIRTLHPDGKTGVHIDVSKYERIKQAILDSIQKRGVISFKELPSAVEENLKEPFEGSISWYTVSVKLDLEARGVIERIPKRSPQELRMVDKQEG
jgi:hypothetical protein